MHSFSTTAESVERSHKIVIVFWCFSLTVWLNNDLEQKLINSLHTDSFSYELLLKNSTLCNFWTSSSCKKSVCWCRLRQATWKSFSKLSHISLASLPMFLKLSPIRICCWSHLFIVCQNHDAFWSWQVQRLHFSENLNNFLQNLGCIFFELLILFSNFKHVLLFKYEACYQLYYKLFFQIMF